MNWQFPDLFHGILLSREYAIQSTKVRGDGNLTSDKGNRSASTTALWLAAAVLLSCSGNTGGKHQKLWEQHDSLEVAHHKSLTELADLGLAVFEMNSALEYSESDSNNMIRRWKQAADSLLYAHDIEIARLDSTILHHAEMEVRHLSDGATDSAIVGEHIRFVEEHSEMSALVGRMIISTTELLKSWPKSYGDQVQH